MRIHPFNDITFFDIKSVLRAVMVEDHFCQDAVNFHDAQRSADLDPPVGNLQIRMRLAFARLDLFHVHAKRRGAVVVRGNPDLVTV